MGYVSDGYAAAGLGQDDGGGPGDLHALTIAATVAVSLLAVEALLLYTTLRWLGKRNGRPVAPLWTLGVATVGVVLLCLMLLAGTHIGDPTYSGS